MDFEHMRKVLIWVFASLIASSATAQEAEKRCSLHDQMAELLLTQYDEHPIGSVLEATGIEHEMFASPTGTWTIIVNLPDGISCVVGTGNAKSLGAMPGLGRPM
jgi:hypothetical protein